EQAIPFLCQALALEEEKSVIFEIMDAIAAINKLKPKNIMSESPKVQMTFNAPITGFAANVEGDMIVNPAPKTPAETAAEIQDLLDQLAKSNPLSSQSIQQEIQQNADFKSKLTKILTAGSIETVKIIFAPLGIPIEMLKVWLEIK
ncbi:MAG: HEAT repeat domain-containing protein, partial [Microcystaceae cyanobacterium]